ncbi:MAG TPA: D-alanine--D-alanine ligase [Methylomusa anaerophila]|uniref:D-alanine--D-alanine ligase n=1 Tax=Methylomusa anaerophila TaxID=1930071 RepID=A0A348AFU6_9FIRM|nr:D-alanine--D-alanine ligase [Methylomusa anaerophila]BBB89944.1 D-alanine--D-alanine ligase A [Methylomusa anaerophila]HML88329.1 D-alanine--D-alanine ligase [Methylomusa anaerophila]
MKKIRVGILFGGRSAEHEVSLQSAQNIIDAIDKDKYDVTLIGIDKQGQWHLNDKSQFLLNSNDPKLIALNKSGKNVMLIPGSPKQQLIHTADQGADAGMDVIFPVLHGSYGEDGTVQGLLKLANIPFVGAGVLGSAVGMDKDVMKRLLRDAGIPIASFKVYYGWEQDNMDFAGAVKELGLPLFVKPANMGSSVGVSKVRNEAEFMAAMKEAFRFDNKVLVEEFVPGREVECAVLGNDSPIASAVGEIIAQQDFYSYEAKYIDENGAVLEIPAKISPAASKEIQDIAIKAFKVLCCEGMARVDCFLTPENGVIVNEINTIPGFTRISMYPKLWEISGIAYSDLIDRLIQLALERHTREQRLQTSYAKT